MLLTPDPIAAAAFAALDRLHPGGPLGVAVSGGGDSLALMLLAVDWARARGVALEAASVDHGLRPEAGAEAAAVAARAAVLGLRHAVLVWRGWDGKGNLQGAARVARAGLLARWAAERGLAAVATGHTLDDQAETVLMRLAHGAGSTGLAGIPERATWPGVLLIRPLLGLRRSALRDWLAKRGEGWSEDPSNDDPRFERARARLALAALAPLGLTADRLAAVARAAARARDALDAATAELAARAGALGALGEVLIDRPALLAAPEEIALRLLLRGLRAASGDPAAPHVDALDRLRAAIAAGPAGRRTLHGCLVAWSSARVALAREPAAAARAGPPAAGLWDGRWRVAPATTGVVGALGERGAAVLRAAARAGRWRPPAGWAAAPRGARLSSPALWLDGALVSAPAAAYGDGMAAEPAAAL